MATSDTERDVSEKFENTKLNSGDEEEEEEEDPDTFTVEKIVGHRKEDGGTMYHIKWADYPDSENTWETEENIIDKEMLTKYWDDKKAEKAARESAKRSASKTTVKAEPRSQSPAISAANKRRRTSGVSKAKVDSDASDSDAPGPEADNWEPLVKEIQTVDRTEKNKLIVFIKWKNDQVTKHPIEMARLKCPQAMLQFYEERLRFRSK